MRAFLPFLLACAATVLRLASTGGVTVTLLHTNDIHSHFDEYNPFGGECTEKWRRMGRCFGGYPRLATKVAEIRANESNVLLVDAGDQSQGTVWYSVFGPAIVSQFMNAVGYDLMALGNHEFDGGVTDLLPFLKAVNFPVISSNIDIEHDHLRGLINDSFVWTVQGEEIGIVGYITWMTKFISNPGYGISFTDELESLQQEVDMLLARGINKIIALGHSGYHVDLEIAKRVRGVDMVIGGHTNTFLYSGTPPTGNAVPVEGPYPTLVTSPVQLGKKVLVVQANQFALYLGYLKVTFDDAGDIVSWSGNPILLDMSVPKDPALERDVQHYKAQLLNQTSQVLGNTRVFMDDDHCSTSECNLGNMVCDAFVYSHLKRSNKSGGWNEAAVCINNAGCLRSPLVETHNDGDIALRDLIDVIPFMNTLDVIEVRGDVILQILERSAASYGSPRFLQFSGLRVTYDIARAIGDRVREVEVLCSNCRVPQFEKLNRTKTYKIVTSTFLSNGGDGYTMLKENRTSYQPIGELDTDAVADYLKHNTPVTTGIEERIRFTTSQPPSPVPSAPAKVTTTTTGNDASGHPGHFKPSPGNGPSSASSKYFRLAEYCVVLALMSALLRL